MLDNAAFMAPDEPLTGMYLSLLWVLFFFRNVQAVAGVISLKLLSNDSSLACDNGKIVSFRREPSLSMVKVSTVLVGRISSSAVPDS